MKVDGLVGPDLSASGGLFRYPDYLVHLHYRPLHLLYTRVPTTISCTRAGVMSADGNAEYGIMGAEKWRV